MEQELIEFLKKHKVYREFVKKAKFDKKDTLSAFCERNDPATYIASGLVWKDSPKGFLFWINLSDKWLKLLDSESL